MSLNANMLPSVAQQLRCFLSRFLFALALSWIFFVQRISTVMPVFHWIQTQTHDIAQHFVHCLLDIHRGGPSVHMIQQKVAYTYTGKVANTYAYRTINWKGNFHNSSVMFKKTGIRVSTLSLTHKLAANATGSYLLRGSCSMVANAWYKYVCYPYKTSGCKSRISCCSTLAHPIQFRAANKAQ